MFFSDWWPARALVSKALESRFEVHSSGRIIVLESGGCPFKEHLYELEEEQEISGQILFVLFVDLNGSWRVLTVGVKDKMVSIIFDSSKQSLKWPLLPSIHLPTHPGTVFVFN